MTEAIFECCETLVTEFDNTIALTIGQVLFLINIFFDHEKDYLNETKLLEAVEEKSIMQVFIQKHLHFRLKERCSHTNQL